MATTYGPYNDLQQALGNAAQYSYANFMNRQLENQINNVLGRPGATIGIGAGINYKRKIKEKTFLTELRAEIETWHGDVLSRS